MVYKNNVLYPINPNNVIIKNFTKTLQNISIDFTGT